jgi:hypothetical protein
VEKLCGKSSASPLGPLQTATPLLETARIDGMPNPTSVTEMHCADGDVVDGSTRHANSIEDLSQTPITSLYQMTRLRSFRSKRLPSGSNGTTTPLRNPRDLISRGILDWNDADRLTRSYLAKPDHYLYGVANKYNNLESIRSASSLLLIAICTVAALQDLSGRALYRVCHTELRRLVSTFVFSTHVDLEDFRGLCIACFWLSDIAWSISGLAIRRAVEFELQKSYHLIVEPQASSSNSTSTGDVPSREITIERVRLWYLFYICDQHLSILYARPSIIREQDAIRNCEAYLSIVKDSTMDMRIVSQVALLRILDTATELLGPNVNSRILTVFRPQLLYFNRLLDQWVTTWLAKCGEFDSWVYYLNCVNSKTVQEHHAQIGGFPSKAVTLHFYFAKLLVCSSVFRGLTSDAITDPIPVDFKDIAMMAVESAKLIVNLTVQDEDIRMAFVDVPHYYHTMIAFACSFLLKVATKYREQIDIDATSVFDMIGQVVTQCKGSQVTSHHLVHLIGEGLKILLLSCSNATVSHEGRQRQADDQEIDSQEEPLLIPDSSLLPSEQGGTMDITQSLGTIWENAREAAVNYPNDRFVYKYDQPYNMGDIFGPMNSMTTPPIDLDGLDVAWEPFLNSVNFEHMGLGLL